MFGRRRGGNRGLPGSDRRSEADDIRAMRVKIDRIAEDLEQIHKKMIAPVEVAQRVMPAPPPRGRVRRYLASVGPAFLVMLAILTTVAEPSFVWTARRGPSQFMADLLALALFVTWVAYRWGGEDAQGRRWSVLGVAFTLLLPLPLAVDAGDLFTLGLLLTYVCIGLSIGGSSAYRVTRADMRLKRVLTWAQQQYPVTVAMGLGLVVATVVGALPMPNAGWVWGGAFVVFLVGYLLGNALLRPILEDFVGAAPYLCEMVRPVLGFAALYFSVIWVFATYYDAAYVRDPLRSFTSLPPHPSLGDFLYFSITTFTTIGLSPISPQSATTRLFASIELVLNPALTVVLFAAIIAYLNRRFAQLDAQRQGDNDQ